MRRHEVAVRHCKPLKLSSTTTHRVLQAVNTKYSRVGAQGSGYFDKPHKTACLQDLSIRSHVTCCVNTSTTKETSTEVCDELSIIYSATHDLLTGTLP